MKRSTMAIITVALLISLVSLGLITLPPLLKGPTVIRPDLAFEWLGLNAVVWGVAVGLETILEMRRARIAEFEPLLDAVVREKNRPSRMSLLIIELRNLGRGAAVGIEALAVFKDEGQEFWVSHLFDEVPESLAPGEAGAGSIEIGTGRFWFKEEEEPTLLGIELRYRDPLSHMHVVQSVYGPAKDSRGAFKRIDQPFPTNKADKLDALKQKLDAMGVELGLEDRGMSFIIGRQDNGFVVTLRKAGKVCFCWGASNDDSIGVLALGIQGDIEEYLRQEASSQDAPSADSSQTSPPYT